MQNGAYSSIMMLQNIIRVPVSEWDWRARVGFLAGARDFSLLLETWG
jgi:hypothetical protein